MESEGRPPEQLPRDDEGGGKGSDDDDEQRSATPDDGSDSQFTADTEEDVEDTIEAEERVAKEEGDGNDDELAALAADAELYVPLHSRCMIKVESVASFLQFIALPFNNYSQKH